MQTKRIVNDQNISFCWRKTLGEIFFGPNFLPPTRRPPCKACLFCTSNRNLQHHIWNVRKSESTYRGLTNVILIHRMNSRRSLLIAHIEDLCIHHWLFVSQHYSNKETGRAMLPPSLCFEHIGFLASFKYAGNFWCKKIDKIRLYIYFSHRKSFYVNFMLPKVPCRPL